MNEADQKAPGAAPGLPEDAQARLRQALAAREADIRRLLRGIKARLPELAALLCLCNLR